MSLILDALRKSEAERRRGQVPDLHTERAPGVQPARDVPPVWLWMTLALATGVVLALVLWLVRSTLAVPPGASAEPDSRAYIDATTGAPSQPVLADTAAPITEPDLAATAPSGRSTTVPEPPTLTEPLSAPRPSAAGDTATLATPSPSPTATRETTQPRIVPRMDAIATDRSSSAPPADAGPAPKTPAAAATVTTASAPAGPTETSAIPAAVMPHPATMLLSDLSVSQREKLPPLKMSMHLWAPTQRFAIIDGARVSEGDRVADAVVEEITPSGVVLAWQGLRLHIPVR